MDLDQAFSGVLFAPAAHFDVAAGEVVGEGDFPASGQIAAAVGVFSSRRPWLFSCRAFSPWWVFQGDLGAEGVEVGLNPDLVEIRAVIEDGQQFVDPRLVSG